MASANASSPKDVRPPIPENNPQVPCLRKLPPELRLKIYPQNAALALTHNLSPPPLLLALHADPEMFKEALVLYNKINASVSPASTDAFKQKEAAEMDKIMHLRIECRPASLDQFMRGNRLTKENNLRSIMVVPWAFIGEEDKLKEAIRVLCKSSYGGVRKVAVVAVPEGVWPFGSGSSIEFARKLSVRLGVVLGVKGAMME